MANRIQAKCASKYEAKPGNSNPGKTAPNINTGKSKHLALEGDMENLGSLAILLAFCLALYATVGVRRRPPQKQAVSDS